MKAKLTESKILFFSFLTVGILLIFLFSLRISDSLKNSYVVEGKIAFDRAYLILEEKVNSYIYGLQGIGGVYIVSSQFPSRKQVRDYAQFRKFFSNFPGVLGYGFIRKIQSENLDTYLKLQREEIPDFKIRTLEPPTSNARMIIECIEPLEVNKSALGLDISTEKNRRAAANSAMLTGEASLTSPVKLVQLGQENDGFLFLLPIYNVPYTPLSTADREKSVVGWVYAPILITGIVEYLKSAINPSLAIKVSEQIPQGNIKIFSTGYATEQKYKRTLEIGGKIWIVEGSYERADRKTIIDFLPILIFLTLSFVFTGTSYLARQLLFSRNAPKN